MKSPTTNTLDHVIIDGLKVSFFKDDNGGKHYRQRTHVEEAVSPFYGLVAARLKPTHCIDIGANYGFTSMVMRRSFPGADVISIEPVPWLCEMIERNFEENALEPPHVIQAIVGAEAETEHSFGINAKGGSQDNRVVPIDSDWGSLVTRATTIDIITNETPSDSRFYVKVDTQGYEFFVFEGAENFFSRFNDWIVKAEFAPAWIESQGCDPAEFLRYLTDRFAVFEHPDRFQWNASSIFDGVGGALRTSDCDAFLNYVRSLNARGQGWVDLLIMPKTFLPMSQEIVRPLRERFSRFIR
ncbi:MAG: FkbM family methyltransferase [Pseudomonadota bacterium]